MENIVWRNGLGRATGPERLLLLQAEHEAIQRAIKEWYDERLAETDSLVADAHDLTVRGASTFWGRKAGCLFVRVTVYGRSAGRIRTFCWRATVRPTATNGDIKQYHGL